MDVAIFYSWIVLHGCSNYLLLDFFGKPCEKKIKSKNCLALFSTLKSSNLVEEPLSVLFGPKIDEMSHGGGGGGGMKWFLPHFGC